MSSTTPGTTGARIAGNQESLLSAVSWAAVLAGAVVAAALSMVLISAGTALGFALSSPWGDVGETATAIGIGAVIWLIVVQIASSGLGGYVAGRLRTRWVDVHADEVYFRDTAHGLLAWAVGALLGAVLVSAAASSLIGGAARLAGGAAAGVGSAAASAVGAAGAAGAAGQGMPAMDYLRDALFRRDTPDPSADPADARAEVGRILSASLASGELSAEDRAYISRVVAQQAGIDPAAAEKRVNELTERAKAAADQARQRAQEAADTARKAAAGAALWVFVSLLAGALSASYLATIGGRARDRVH